MICVSCVLIRFSSVLCVGLVGVVVFDDGVGVGVWGVVLLLFGVVMCESCVLIVVLFGLCLVSRNSGFLSVLSFVSVCCCVVSYVVVGCIYDGL